MKTPSALSVAVGLVVLASSCTGSADQGFDVSEVTAHQTTQTTGASETAPPTSDSVDPVELATSSTTAVASVGSPATPQSPAYIIGGGWLLGTWDGTNWNPVRGEIDTPPIIPEGLRLQSLGSQPTGVTSTEAIAACEWLAADESSVPYQVEIDGAAVNWAGAPGTTGAWPLQPRPVEAVGDFSPYVSQVNDFLATLSVTEQAANIVSVWRTDIEGDGVTEVIIEARKTEGDNLINQAPGNYSVVLIVSDETDDLPVGIYLDGIASDAPPEESGYGYTLTRATPLGILDLNGDGRAEIVLATTGWESGWITVFEQIDGVYQPVLTEGCGS